MLFFLCSGYQGLWIRLLLAGQVQCWEQVKNLAVVDEVGTFSVQANEMGAVLTTLAPNTRFNTKQVGIGAIDTLPK